MIRNALASNTIAFAAGGQRLGSRNLFENTHIKDILIVFSSHFSWKSLACYKYFRSQIRTIDRKQEVPHDGPMCDLLWSDPEGSLFGLSSDQ